MAKVLKITRKYLYRVQNSVFEGEIAEANLRMLKSELLKQMDEKEDSIIIYKFRTTKYYNKELYGMNKGGESLFI